jgi:heptaprenyl diphosphate synthase
MVKKMVIAALLTAIALTVYVIESNIPALTPVPGIKLGLSNIITVFALYILGPKIALAVLVCRVMLGGFVTGQPMAILYSMSGGLLAFLFAVITYRKFPKKQIWVLSSLSAIIHNLGQITVAVLITSTAGLFIFIPALVASGIITGAFTGTAAQALLHRMVITGIGCDQCLYKYREDP